jgi:hypothetical protein
MEAFHTQTPVEAPISCTAFLAIPIDPAWTRCDPRTNVTKEVTMDKEKEGLSTSAQEAIATAAKANVDALAEVISSAATAHGRSCKTFP